MTRGRQFGVVLVSVLAIASLVSHLITWLTRIDTRLDGNDTAGTQFHARPILVAGSSTIGVALNMELLAADWARPVVVVHAPAGSPCELEYLTPSVTNSDLAIVGVSVLELDEDCICDFRADVVPIGQTARDLWNSSADWPFVKRTMSRYPLSYLQILFPTAGRSIGIMVGLRARMRQVLRLAGYKGGEAPLLFHVDDNAMPTNSMTDWPEARVLRNLSGLRANCHGQHHFEGPKHLAFQRMLARLTSQGKVLVVVLPVSPAYANQLLQPADHAACEKSLEDIKKQFPRVAWLRLDQMPELRTTDVFSDMVHLNLSGRQIATPAILERLKSLVRAP